MTNFGLLERIIADMEKCNPTSIYKTGVYVPGIWRSNNPLDQIIHDMKGS
jgi:hypothetical protein